MGLIFSRVVDVKMQMPIKQQSRKVQARNKNLPATSNKKARCIQRCISRKRCDHKKAAIQQLRNKQISHHRSPFLSTRKDSSCLRSCRYGYYNKLPAELTSSAASASQCSIFPFPYSVVKAIKTLIIEDSNMDSLKTKGKTAAVKRKDTTFLVEKESVNFDELVARQEKFAKNNEEDTQSKVKKFVMAWKTALAYSKTKKEKAISSIPVAATSHCKKGTKSCTRCYRRMACAKHEEVLADFVHQESLQQFIEETEQFQATSSIIIREDLKRKHLFSSVISHADSSVKDLQDLSRQQQQEENVADEDELVIHFNLPPPVHIDYNPNKNLYEKGTVEKKKILESSSEKIK